MTNTLHLTFEDGENIMDITFDNGNDNRVMVLSSDYDSEPNGISFDEPFENRVLRF